MQAVSFAEFLALTEFLAHEEQFLAGMPVLVSIEQAEIGELLPHVAGHFVKQRILAVNDFVMREGKHEVLGEGVEQGECQLVLLVPAVNRIGRKIFQACRSSSPCSISG